MPLTSSMRMGSCFTAAAAPAYQTTATCLMGCGKRGSKRRRPSAALYKSILGYFVVFHLLCI